MAKILNLIIQDRDGFKDPKTFVESFEIREDVREPEKALHDAVKEFISSGSSESVKAMEYTCGCFNWGDALSSVPDSLFAKHGLTKLNRESIDIFVDHDEVLCE